jgi:hypothetical protein
VLQPANFKDHKFVDTPTHQMMKAKLFIGARVRIISRMSTHFGPDRIYLDILEHQVGFIKGGVVNGDPVVLFAQMVNGVEVQGDVKVKIENLELAPNDDAACGAGARQGLIPTAEAAAVAAGSAAKLVKCKEHKFLEQAETKSLEVFKNFPKHLSNVSDEQKLKTLHSALGLSLSKVFSGMPTYTDKDFVVCIRDHQPEVWTLRPFGKGEIAFAPETNQFMDRNWCQATSALVRHDNSLHPQKLNLVLDGRLRHMPNDQRPFSLFFAVTRVQEPTEANMRFQHAEVTITSKVTLPHVAHMNAIDSTPLPQVPFMVNMTKIEAHKKLTCTLDVELQAVQASATRKRAADIKNEHAKNTAAKKKKAHDDGAAAAAEGK